MCGGRGTRLGTATEKPLYEVGGQPMVDSVLGALTQSAVETVYAVGSPAVPNTITHLTEGQSVGAGCEVIEAPGDGYVDDLSYALGDIDPPVLTVTADLPLLDADTLDAIVTEHTATSVTVCVPATLKKSLGLNVDTTMDRDGQTLAPTGLNIVAQGDGNTVVTSTDIRLAINVNYRRDARIAEVFL
jgi:adenosylcobinamide-phosphate guanylyltransferase